MRLTVVCLFTIALIGCTLSAAAQTTPTPADPLALVGKPALATIVMELDVNKPAKDVWARIGKFCGIRDWAQMECSILKGKEDEVGAIRSVGTEIMVGKTELSYTYNMPPRSDRPYNHYHGTIEARPVTATTSRLIYTLMFDTSVQADDAAREKYAMQMRNTFTRFLGNMKILAEGGTLPAPAKK